MSKTRELDAGSGRSEHNAAMLATAHRRLRALTDAAESDNLFGSVAVEIVFRGGRIEHVRRKLEGSDKL